MPLDEDVVAAIYRDHGTALNLLCSAVSRTRIWRTTSFRKPSCGCFHVNLTFLCGDCWRAFRRALFRHLTACPSIWLRV